MGRTGSQISGLKAPLAVAPAAPSAVFVQPSGWRRFWRIFWFSLLASMEDNILGIAKGAAYSGLLAFFPVLASLAAILVQAKAESMARIISEFLFEVVPPGSQELVEYEFAIKGQRPVLLIIFAALLSLWAASGAMISLMEGFDAAYRLPGSRPIIKQRLVAILMTFTLALPTLLASSFIVFGTRLEPLIDQWLGLSIDEQMKTSVAVAGLILRYAIALSTIVLVTGLLYYFGANRALKLKTVWPGASMATVLWALATGGFAWYVRNIANYNVMYGSIGAVIAMLVWMYLLAVITLWGCEFNAERQRQAGH